MKKINKANIYAISSYTDGTYLISDWLAGAGNCRNSGEFFDHISAKKAKKFLKGKHYKILNYCPDFQKLEKDGKLTSIIL